MILDFHDKMYLLYDLVIICFFIGFISQIILRKKLQKKLDDYVKNSSNFRGKLQNIEEELSDLNALVRRNIAAKSDELQVSDEITVEEEILTEEPQDEPHTVDQKVVEELKPSANIQSGLLKTRASFFTKLKNIFTKPKIDQSSFDEIEQILIESDLGVSFVTKLLADLKTRNEISQDELLDFVKAEIKNILQEKTLQLDGTPAVILMLGVNGVGKTTTCAKLASLYKSQGKKVLLAAADTFRAAAVEQLKVWGDRLDVEVVSGEENCKPQTVVYSAMEKAKAEQYDLVIIDTAGRLHNKSNLMLELEGISNTIKKFNENGANETLLVIDAVTGQNGLVQAKEFNEVVKLSGLVVTKLDGTPKGGIVVAINNELSIPVAYLGVGEGVSELKEFSKDEFLEALFTEPKEAVESSANAEVRRVRRSI